MFDCVEKCTDTWTQNRSAIVCETREREYSNKQQSTAQNIQLMMIKMMMICSWLTLRTDTRPWFGYDRESAINAGSYEEAIATDLCRRQLESICDYSEFIYCKMEVNCGLVSVLLFHFTWNGFFLRSKRFALALKKLFGYF